MRIGITGGNGFIGSHLVNRLNNEGHDLVVLVCSAPSGKTTTPYEVVSNLSDISALSLALSGCDAVAHCAGINREIGIQTFQPVHIEGMQNVVAAAHAAGVKKIVLISFLRSRAHCGSPSHASQWAAEEIVRDSGLDYTIIKAGVVYGLGD